MADLAITPEPPYYAVILTSLKTGEYKEYDKYSAKMVELASLQDGFLGVESVQNELGITISYWRDEDSIKKWKANLAHIQAQKMGQKIWYKNYKIRIAKVERDYEFTS